MGILDKVINEEKTNNLLEDAKKLEKELEKDKYLAEREAVKKKMIPYIKQALAEFPDACRALGGGPVPLLRKRKPSFFNRKDYEYTEGYHLGAGIVDDYPRLFLTVDNTYLINPEERGSI